MLTVLTPKTRHLTCERPHSGDTFSKWLWSQATTEPKCVRCVFSFIPNSTACGSKISVWQLGVVTCHQHKKKQNPAGWPWSASHEPKCLQKVKSQHQNKVGSCCGPRCMMKPKPRCHKKMSAQPHYMFLVHIVPLVCKRFYTKIKSSRKPCQHQHVHLTASFWAGAWVVAYPLHSKQLYGTPMFSNSNVCIAALFEVRVGDWNWIFKRKSKIQL